MQRMLLALTFAVLPQLAFAQPPSAGSTHTFYDPMFAGTVFCDTIDQVREIATAERPEEVFQNYLQTRNALNEPTCATITPTGVVVDVKPIGVMVEDGLHFNAWVVETRVGNGVGFALYLEQFEYVSA